MCPEEHADEVADRVKAIMIEAMEYVVKKRVPIEVDIAIQGNW